MYSSCAACLQAGFKHHWSMPWISGSNCTATVYCLIGTDCVLSTGISLPAGTVSVAGARPQCAESHEAPAGAHPAASASGLRSAPGPPSIAPMTCELARLVNASAQHHALHARAGGGDCEAAKASAPGAKGASAQALRRHHTPLRAPLLHHNVLSTVEQHAR